QRTNAATAVELAQSRIAQDERPAGPEGQELLEAGLRLPDGARRTGVENVAALPRRDGQETVVRGSHEARVNLGDLRETAPGNGLEVRREERPRDLLLLLRCELGQRIRRRCSSEERGGRIVVGTLHAPDQRRDRPRQDDPFGKTGAPELLGDPELERERKEVEEATE